VRSGIYVSIKNDMADKVSDETTLPDSYIPPKTREKIKIPGRSEEEVKKIYIQKSVECNRLKRARNNKAKRGKKRMHFTTCFLDDYSVTEENVLKLRLGLARVCQELNCSLKETCKPRFAVNMVDREDVCNWEYHGNAKQEMEELLGRKISG
jgi:hypothetical protein